MHTLTFSWAESWHNAVLVTHQADFHLLLILNCKEWRMHSTPGEYKWLKTLATPNGSPTCAHTKFFTQLFGNSPIKWYTTKIFQSEDFTLVMLKDSILTMSLDSFPKPPFCRYLFQFFSCQFCQAIAIGSFWHLWVFRKCYGPCTTYPVQMLRPVYAVHCINVTARVRHTLYVLFHPQIWGYFLLPQICRHRIFPMILWNLTFYVGLLLKTSSSKSRYSTFRNVVDSQNMLYPRSESPVWCWTGDEMQCCAQLLMSWNLLIWDLLMLIWDLLIWEPVVGSELILRTTVGVDHVQ